MIQALLGLLIIYSPINLFLKFGLERAYVNGRLVDYLMGKIYLTDVIIFALLLLTCGWKKLDLRAVEKLGWLWIGAWLVWQIYMATSFNLLLLPVRLGLFILLMINISKLKIKNFKDLGWLVVGALLLQLAIGSYHFYQQKPLLGYAFLGESRIEDAVGIAKSSLGGVEQTLAYGSTAHPNILAGWFLLMSVWWWQVFRPTIKTNWLRKNLSTLILFSNVWVIFITQSLAAAAGLILAVSAYWSGWNGRRLISFTLAAAIFSSIAFYFLPTSSLASISRRARLEQAAFTLFTNQPLAGVGLGNFTAKLETVSSGNELVRFIQPPHNIIWLWLAETGLLGVGWLWITYRLFLKHHWQKNGHPAKMIWLSLLPLALLDHYLISTQTGLLTLVFLLTVTQPPKLESVSA